MRSGPSRASVSHLNAQGAHLMCVCVGVGTNLRCDPAQETLGKIFLGQLGVEAVVSNLREMWDETKTIIQL